MKKLLFLCLFVLVSCATEGEYRRYVSKYIGMSEDDLVAAEGIPTKRYSTKNKKYFDYKQSYYDKSLGKRLTCTTTYILVNSIIEDISFRGNNCVKAPDNIFNI